MPMGSEDVQVFSEHDGCVAATCSVSFFLAKVLYRLSSSFRSSFGLMNDFGRCCVTFVPFWSNLVSVDIRSIRLGKFLIKPFNLNYDIL